MEFYSLLELSVASHFTDPNALQSSLLANKYSCLADLVHQYELRGVCSMNLGGCVYTYTPPSLIPYTFNSIQINSIDFYNSIKISSIDLNISVIASLSSFC